VKKIAATAAAREEVMEFVPRVPPRDHWPEIDDALHRSVVRVVRPFIPFDGHDREEFWQSIFLRLWETVGIQKRDLGEGVAGSKGKGRGWVVFDIQRYAQRLSQDRQFFPGDEPIVFDKPGDDLATLKAKEAARAGRRRERTLTWSETGWPHPDREEDLIHQKAVAPEPRDVSPRLIGLLDQLSTRQSEALKWRLSGTLTYVEIGEKMGITAGAVRTHVERGLTRLRDKYGVEVLGDGSGTITEGAKRKNLEKIGPSCIQAPPSYLIEGGLREQRDDRFQWGLNHESGAYTTAGRRGSWGHRSQTGSPPSSGCD
jgi:DNA-binding CsgD family transcriptional regulator